MYALLRVVQIWATGEVGHAEIWLHPTNEASQSIPVPLSNGAATPNPGTSVEIPAGY